MSNILLQIGYHYIKMIKHQTNKRYANQCLFSCHVTVGQRQRSMMVNAKNKTESIEMEQKSTKCGENKKPSYSRLSDLSCVYRGCHSWCLWGFRLSLLHRLLHRLHSTSSSPKSTPSHQRKTDMNLKCKCTYSAYQEEDSACFCSWI